MINMQQLAALIIIIIILAVFLWFMNLPMFGSWFTNVVIDTIGV